MGGGDGRQESADHREAGEESNPSLDTLRDTVISILLIHKIKVDWLGKNQCPLQYSCNGIELVQCSTARMKTTLLLLNLRCN